MGFLGCNHGSLWRRDRRSGHGWPGWASTVCDQRRGKSRDRWRRPQPARNGDRYRYEPSNAAANAILDGIWVRLVAVHTWVGTARQLTYQFFNDSDPQTHWGRAYRFTGTADNYAGPIRAFTAGTYTRANGSSYQAVILQTWDGNYAEILVLIDPSTFVHAVQNVNGLPITDSFNGH